MCLLRNFLPNRQVNSIFEITPDELKKQGIKGIITDLDNTLVEWNRPLATPKIIEWFEKMKENDIAVTIISNNSENRVKAFSKPHQIPYIFRAKKPFASAFFRALNMMNLKKHEVVVIGDQLLTDIFGGNRAGFYTILVVPVAETDGLTTKFNRFVERRIFSWFERKGMI